MANKKTSETKPKKERKTSTPKARKKAAPKVETKVEPKEEPQVVKEPETKETQKFENVGDFEIKVTASILIVGLLILLVLTLAGRCSAPVQASAGLSAPVLDVRDTTAQDTILTALE